MAFYPNVLLGVPDEVISSVDDLKYDWATNKFGGNPKWIQNVPVKYPQCTLCNSLLPLVAQIYCPLEGSLFHRILYVFGCTNISCWNKKESWKVLRCQSLVQNTHVHETKVAEMQEKESWCDEADEWEENGDEHEVENNSPLQQLEQHTRDLNLTGTVKTTAPLNGLNGDETYHQVKEPVGFIPYYITVIEESQLSSEAKALSNYEKKLLVEYQKREGLTDIEEMIEANGKEWGKEKYEQTVAKHGDKTFQKFQKQLSLCPEQCLRYSWNGEPLLMSSQHLEEIPPCSYCGQRRVFEIQLMPALVLLLESIGTTDTNNLSVERVSTSVDNSEISDSGSAGKNLRDHSQLDDQICKKTMSGSHNIEFGTVFVYTCSKSCWSDDQAFREEYVIVHSDPDQHLFKF